MGCVRKVQRLSFKCEDTAESVCKSSQVHALMSLEGCPGLSLLLPTCFVDCERVGYPISVYAYHGVTFSR